MLEFNLSKSSHKRNRTYKKFPRYKLKENSTPRDLKEWGFCKNNWNDDDYTYVKGNIKKFLMNNIGKPFEKIYAKFLKRWKAGGRYSPREELLRWINRKENITKYIGGFYLSNNILNYKKPIRIDSNEELTRIAENKKRFSQLDLNSLIKLLVETNVPQCLGKYWVGNYEKTIYMKYAETEEIFTKKRIFLPGVGYGVDISTYESQTGKVKYKYNIVTNWGTNPIIYFYYLNKC